MDKPAPRNNAVTAIIAGAILLLGALTLHELNAINTDEFYSLLILGFMSLLVGTICVKPIAEQNRNNNQ